VFDPTMTQQQQRRVGGRGPRPDAALDGGAAFVTHAELLPLLTDAATDLLAVVSNLLAAPVSLKEERG
jgi:hypothetical protein